MVSVFRGVGLALIVGGAAVAFQQTATGDALGDALSAGLTGGGLVLLLGVFLAGIALIREVL